MKQLEGYRNKLTGYLDQLILSTEFASTTKLQKQNLKRS